MSQNVSPAGQALGLYSRRHQGILATVSQSMPGYPFGSVVTFAVDRLNRPVILISSIAEHTRNIKANSKVSLTMTEGGDDSQAEARLTLVGDVELIPDADVEESAARYYRRFPHSMGYHQAHDFAFYRIEPLRYRFIAGFGRINWIESSVMKVASPFSTQDEAHMIDHMNRDHLDAMRGYCRTVGVNCGEQVPRMTAIDGTGFDLMLGHRLVRIDFASPVATPQDVRKAMVALVQRSQPTH